jgi:AcrR family transcriptional regulator
MYRKMVAVNPESRPRRPYRSPRREEQARQTRRALLSTAERMLMADGYSATTIPAVARAAEVSVETVYKLFGNKPGLAKAVYDVAIVGDDEPVPLMDRDFVRQNIAEPDPKRKLITFGEHIAEVAGRASPILLMIRDAAASDAGAADLWETAKQERLTGMSHFARHLQQGGYLRSGVSEREARDVLWTHNSVELWDLLVRQRGWSLLRFGKWTGRQLVAALL